MGIKSVSQELKAKVSPSRLFKGLLTETHDIAPKAAPYAIKGIEIVEGNGISVGSVVQTNFTDGAPFKIAKVRMDFIDTANYVGKFTLIDGDVIGDRVEKMSYDAKIEASADGGSIFKQTIEYHTKGDIELSEEEVKLGNDQAIALFNATEAYLVANPHACA